MKVTCKLCGKQFSTLNSHMHRVHGITVEEYLVRYPGEKTCSDEYHDKQSKAMTRRNSSKEFSKYISKRNIDNWKIKSYRENQVLCMIKRRNAAIKGIHYSNKCLSFVAYKSSSELDYAKFLDNNKLVKNYDSESFVIWYNHNGENLMYIPDFIVNYEDGHIEVVEIKPEYHHTAHDDLLNDKFTAAQNYCAQAGYKFVIIN